VRLRDVDEAQAAVVALAKDLAAQGAQAIGLMGTSLTFFKGYAYNEQLKDTIRAATGLPATTMSTGVVEALRALGVQRVAVGTAYIEEVNNRLRQFLMDSDFEVQALQGLGIDVVGEARNVSEQDLIALGQRVLAASSGADGILISCGGLRTLGVTVPLETATGVPVVSSTPAAFWAAVRLVGHSGQAPGYGRLFALEAPTPSATTAS
jgi:arylmalonate decarboxylase